MNNIKKRQTKVIGRLGEDLAVKFLVKNGFTVIERNYSNKVGEIDIIAIKDKILRFIEVKTVLRETSDLRYTRNIGYKTGVLGVCGDKYNNPHNPEDNVHQWKLEKIAKVAEIYLMFNESKLFALGIEFDDFQIDAIAVTIRKEGKRFMSNIRFFEGVV